jgi:hypothetical protein
MIMNVPEHGNEYILDDSDDFKTPNHVNRYSPPPLLPNDVPQNEQQHSDDYQTSHSKYTQKMNISQHEISSESITKNTVINPERFNDPPLKETQHYEDRDDFNYDDEDIQRDAADNTIVFIVHIAMGFFILLFFGALVVSALIVGQYGFLIFIMVCCLLLVGVTIGYFISKIMDQDRVMRPVRRKIRRWHAIATAVVVNEIKDFQLDIQDHLLLTNGDTSAGIYKTEDEGDINIMRNGRKRRNGPRSKIFGALVKPFLKKKSNFRFGRKKKGTNEVEHVLGTHEMV